MAPVLATLALVLTQGEDRTFTGTHQTSATDTTVINITGWTMVFTARDANKIAVLSKTVTVVSGPNGTYTFTLAAADTNINPTTYACDLWRTDSGNATIMALGTLTINADVRV